MIIEYIAKVIGVWFIGFFPYFEVYIAVPAAIAMNLDYFSAVIWSTLGNFTAIPLVIYLHRQLEEVRWIGGWLKKLRQRSLGRLDYFVENYGHLFVLLGTPVAGAWTIAAIARVLDIPPRRLMVYSFISILLYAIATAFMVDLGIKWFFN